MIGPMLRRALALALALGVMAAIVTASRSSFHPASGQVAVLRVSWSGRPERKETCRRLGTEELEALPVHMRREVECEGRPARYLVRAFDGEALLMADTVTGGGIRGDRAIHMLRDLPLRAGEHRLVVEIARLDSVAAEEEPPDTADGEDEELWRPGTADRERREAVERRRHRMDRLPPRLRWEHHGDLRTGAVVLVSYDPIARRLVGRFGP